MTALESSTFKWGAATYPLSAATTDSTLKAADPAIYYVTDYLATMLTTYVGAAWTARCTQVGGQFTSISASPCAMLLGRDPAPDITAEQVKFPLLAVYRISSKDRDQTLTWERTDEVWRIDYVLPPMDAGERERMIPFLHAAHDVIAKKMSDLQDAAYASGARIGGAGVTGIMEAGVTDARFGLWDAGKQLFPAVQMTAAVTLRRGEPADAYDAMTGIDLAVDVARPSTTTLPDVADQAVAS